MQPALTIGITSVQPERHPTQQLEGNHRAVGPCGGGGKAAGGLGARDIPGHRGGAGARCVRQPGLRLVPAGLPHQGQAPLYAGDVSLQAAKRHPGPLH
eukprot:scaffold166554_cov43-Prasinocladus_malaysianus.AAC.1